MDDQHEVQFTWPSTEPNAVIVTGTFDQWSSSLHLVKGENGFHGSINIPWDTKMLYKYVVDSVWLCETSHPTETDASGYINNVYISPPKPVYASSASVAADTTPDATSNLSQLASDFVDTVAARDGTSSVLGYVASGLGAAIQTTIGVDLINNTREPVESPKPGVQIDPPAVEPSPVASPSMAPLVPIAIVPVNSEPLPPDTSTTPLAVVPDVLASEAASTHGPLPTSIPSPKAIPVSEDSVAEVPTADSEDVKSVTLSKAPATVPDPSPPAITTVTVSETSTSESAKPANGGAASAATVYETVPVAGFTAKSPKPAATDTTPAVTVVETVPSTSEPAAIGTAPAVNVAETDVPASESLMPAAVPAVTVSETDPSDPVVESTSESPNPGAAVIVAETVPSTSESPKPVNDTPTVTVASTASSDPVAESTSELPNPGAAAIVAETVPSTSESPKPVNGTAPAVTVAETAPSDPVAGSSPKLSKPGATGIAPADAVADTVPSTLDSPKPAASGIAPATVSESARAEPVAGSTSESLKPAVTAPTPAEFSASTPTATPASSAPTTPAKNLKHAFPSSESGSPAASKFGSVSSRKKRQSIFGKVKGLFSKDKEEKEK